MSWSYNSSELDKTTDQGRKNIVRYLVGDTDDCGQQLQDEEILFSLGEANDNSYSAASSVATSLSSKYARKVDTELNGALKVSYSTLSKQYKDLASNLKKQALAMSGTSLGVSVGGVLVSVMTNVNELSDRVQPAFTTDQFDNSSSVYNYE